MITFAQMLALAVHTDDYRPLFPSCDFGDEPCAGVAFGSVGYVDRMPSGEYCVDIYNGSACGSLEYCAARLYEWALTENPDALGMDAEVQAFVCQLVEWSEDDEFFEALRANGSPDREPNVCHMHDFCDANEAALLVAYRTVQPDSDEAIDKAHEIYNRASPFLKVTL